jgi:hypothetical protein
MRPGRLSLAIIEAFKGGAQIEIAQAKMEKLR